MIAEEENLEYLFGKGISLKDIKSIKCFVFSYEAVNNYNYSGHCDGRCLNCDDFDPIRGCTYEPDEDELTDEVDSDITDEEYDQIAEDAHNHLIRDLIEAGAKINELRADCKDLTEALFKTDAALSIAIDGYNGPHLDGLRKSEQLAKEKCVEMYNYLVEKE